MKERRSRSPYSRAFSYEARKARMDKDVFSAFCVLLFLSLFAVAAFGIYLSHSSFSVGPSPKAIPWAGEKGFEEIASSTSPFAYGTYRFVLADGTQISQIGELPWGEIFIYGKDSFQPLFGTSFLALAIPTSAIFSLFVYYFSFSRDNVSSFSKNWRGGVLSERQIEGGKRRFALLITISMAFLFLLLGAALLPWTGLLLRKGETLIEASGWTIHLPKLLESFLCALFTPLFLGALSRTEDGLPSFLLKAALPFLYTLLLFITILFPNYLPIEYGYVPFLGFAGFYPNEHWGIRLASEGAVDAFLVLAILFLDFKSSPYGNRLFERLRFSSKEGNQ